MFKLISLCGFFEVRQTSRVRNCYSIMIFLFQVPVAEETLRK